MKTKKENISVRELFSEQLGNAEVSPGNDFETRVMKKLVRKEFLHFIPSKINVYYIGALVAAGVITGLILSSNPENVDSISLKSIIPDTVIINDVVPVADSVSQVGMPDTGNRLQIQPGSLNRETDNLLQEEMVNTDNQIITSTDNELVTPLRNVLIADTGTPGLRASIDVQPAIVGNPVSRFEMSSSVGCLPVRIKFNNTSLNYDSVLWTFGDGGTSGEISPEWIFDEAGSFRIRLTVFNKGGAESVSYNSLVVYPRPLARFEIGPEEVIIPDDEVRFMNYSSGALSYQWNFGDGNTSNSFEPVYKYNMNGNYDVTLRVISEYGCSDTLVVENAFTGSAYSISFPNAFIPNPNGPSGGYYSIASDEAAQVFHPFGIGVASYQLRIFSKLGILIFESNDINIGWDGYYKGQLSEPGVYIWKVRGKFNNGEPFVKMGDVILLKN